jgi:hypothetical protein
MLVLVGDWFLFVPVEDTMEDVWRRVTTLLIGVVRNLEKAPATNPTVNSSRTGRWFVDFT